MSANAIPVVQRARLYETIAPALAALGEGWRDWPAVVAGRDPAGAPFRDDFRLWVGRPAEASSDERAANPLGGARGGICRVDITRERLCPGEDQAGGGPAGRLTIGRAPTPFGYAAWLIGADGLIALSFIDRPTEQAGTAGQAASGEEAAFADILRRFGRIHVRRDDRIATKLARSVFEDGQTLPVCLCGTPFRRRIWNALLDLPPGRTASYAQIAASAGAPGAARAAGASIGANPLGWFIPCHRALAATGRLHNYHWGTARKRAMLVYEQACLPASTVPARDGQEIP